MSLALDTRSLARIRFTTSALWEIGLSALLLRRSQAGPVHAPWVRDTKARTDPHTLQRVLALTAGDSFIADFLTPSRRHERGSASDEIEELRALDPQLIARDLTAVATANRRQQGDGHAWVRHLAAHPTGAVDELTATLADYWAGALAPHWTHFSRLVEDEITTATQLGARDGAAAMLNALHPRIHFTGAALDIEGACDAQLETADASDGLFLVPSAFAWPDAHVQPNAPYQPAIAYAVRGLANLWLPHDDASSHLAQLLGDGRARVLAAIALPATTQELAHDLCLAPSTVNAHLHALTASNLASTRRDGRHVIYHLSDLGRQLLAS